MPGLGRGDALAALQIPLVRAEPGCLEMGVQSVRDPLLFWIHSRWLDEAAFEVHAKLPSTDRFVERAQLDLVAAAAWLRSGRRVGH